MYNIHHESEPHNSPPFACAPTLWVLFVRPNGQALTLGVWAVERANWSAQLRLGPLCSRQAGSRIFVEPAWDAGECPESRVPGSRRRLVAFSMELPSELPPERALHYHGGDTLSFIHTVAFLL